MVGEILELWHSYRVYLLALVVIIAVLFRRTEKNNNQTDEKPSVPARAPSPATREKDVGLKPTAAPIPVDFTQLYSKSGSSTSSDEESSTKASPKKIRRVPKKFTGGVTAAIASGKAVPTALLPSVESKIIVFFSTLTGSSERYAQKVHKRICQISQNTVNPPELVNLDYVEDLDPYFVSPKEKYAGTIYLLIVPSYETESPLDFFIESLKETYGDFRIDSRPLNPLAGFSVFGLGDKEGWPEESKFCYQARQVDKLLGKLGARRVFPLGTGCIKTDGEANLNEWLDHLENTLNDPSPPEDIDIADSDDEEETDEIDESVVDVEDMGKIIKKSKEDIAACSPEDDPTTTTKQMVAKDSPTYKSLTKQGYTVVGSHSGVKICRWTKSALRGRGSCYKYSFYGIKSHLCMEATPSLSCSNKCVFCWRHGTNPVGTTWRWQVDAPDVILKGALEGHYKKIKQLKGVPGVVASRFAEAFTVRHCALSLVGEPIFYPHINEFVGMLHERHISSFLVCNAQHPAELAALKRVTQLYVSIDASNKESLKKVDRPLHRDFWERMEKCLDILREKKLQRTVFRLTLVKDFNIDEHEGYADLVVRGEPCFIEVKGVTYCGTSKSNPLTMQNVPFYEEVKAFVENLNASLAARGLEYDIAAEHAHSCCILIAQKRFKIDGVWHTAINYDKFFSLLESGDETFTPMDYIAPTPQWAQYGSDEGGFNPDDTRFSRKKPVV
ncbi:Tyw1p [Sugiyamaella lignohabitans]|uniref:S-adenosyl-L-methionine-dependent tRNA 4-demethylwyosine synthase n=1 Tax=Sugiyamaella lignohabitans TaxID=796027 RepID=A0A161HMT6_9ASCO|nr:Tyw1p [Sugiyamaella lignohabitans]ANB15237.1 Tyw1p [Sugiyamaella lignohabitans]